MIPNCDSFIDLHSFRRFIAAVLGDGEQGIALLLYPNGRLDWLAGLPDRRACARLGAAVGLAALCASGALAQSSAPNAATAPIPGSAPIAGNSGELIETPIGS